jgi:type IV pilus assembly protein PilB
VNTIASVPPRKKLGEILAAAGLIDEKQLNTALAEQRKWGGRLGRTLVELGYVDEMTMSAALSRQLQLPGIDLSTTELSPQITRFLPVDLCERHGVMPVSADAERRVLRVASSDPTNADALREIANFSRLHIEPMVATPTDIDYAIRRYYYGEVPAGTPAHSQQTARPPAPAPTPAPAPRPPTHLPPAANPGDDGIAEGLARVEALLGSEVRALRVLVQLLVDKGVISRDEYVAKMKAPGSKGS